ncbi:MAG: sulfite exporter TauE/SafE family protein [Nanoarchaeota archaeon]
MKHTRTIPIAGMTCAACEVLIERRLRKIAHVSAVKVDRAKSSATISSTQPIEDRTITEALKGTEYTVCPAGKLNKKRGKDYLHIGGVFVVLIGAWLLLKKFELVPQMGISDNMSLGFIVILGLVAAMSSCMAVTGGLLLAVSTAAQEANPKLTRSQRFRPHAIFNLGRIVGYTLLGGLIGVIGSLILITPKVTGILTILASIVMILLGVQMLGIIPWLSKFTPRLPTSLAHKIYEKSGATGVTAPFLLGASSFFLPCGFTQALQIYVLSTGSFSTGATTMLAFSLGTLPGLLSIGAVTSLSRGNFQRWFTKFAAAAVIMLGAFSITNGMALAGAPVSFGGATPTLGLTQTVADVQIVRMAVNGYEYEPSRFTVKAGVPVRWEVDGSRAAGCAQVISIPSLGRVEYLSREKTTVIEFTPDKTGTIPFSCTMGMTTPGAAFTVVENPDAPQLASATTAGPSNIKGGKAQHVSVSVDNDGFHPDVIDVKVGIPVEMEIDTKIRLGGCMGTMVIPKWGVAHQLSLGKTTLRFTPTEAGVFPFTCSMGSKYGDIRVSA